MLFAIKTMKKQKIKELKIEELIFREIKIHLYAKHENIVALYDVFDDENHIYLVLEYMSEGTIFKEWKKTIEIKE